MKLLAYLTRKLHLFLCKCKAFVWTECEYAPQNALFQVKVGAQILWEGY